MQRPDTPLANTPEPAPVSSGMQPMGQAPAQPVSKYQVTADAAIQQIGKLSRESMSQVATQPTNNQQQQQ
jgi:hypothetical protein